MEERTGRVDATGAVPDAGPAPPQSNEETSVDGEREAQHCDPREPRQAPKCAACAPALDAEQEARHARSKADGETASDKIARLQALTAALADARAVERAAAVVCAEGAATLGAAAVGVLLYTEDGSALELVGYHDARGRGLAPRRSLPADDPGIIATAVRTSRVQWVFGDELDEASPWPKRLAANGLHALVALPLRVDRRRLGALALGFAAHRCFTDDEERFALILADQCAQAVDRARLSEAERRARTDAEEAHRAKDEFLGVVSHELRTPLSAILGWSHLLRTKPGDVAVLERGLDIIERNARAQVQIVDDILDVSRIIAGKLRLAQRRVDLIALVRSCLEVVRPAAQAKGVTLALGAPLVRGEGDDHPAYGDRGGGPIAPVAGDPDRLQQVLWNLLSNAIKFTPRGGRVEVAVERSAGEVVITVSDTGAGIDPAFVPHVFERFRQADSSVTRRHGGLGLGLAIVRHIVELHGGLVSVESDGPNHGSRFSVRLPISVEPATPGLLDGAPAEPPRPGVPGLKPLDGLRVLFVDDEPDARETIAAVLASYGAAVHVEGSAARAAAVLDEVKPDVLLSDIGMPGEDGFALLRRIRALPSSLAGIPAVALTAYAGDEEARRTLGAGFAAHLAKPVEPSVLSATLAAAAGRAERR